MFDILEIFDKETTIYFAIISVISIFLLYFIFRHTFKHSSNLRVFFLSVIIYIFMAGTGLTIYYVSQNEYIFSSVEKYHIKGRVTRINDEFVEINVTSSSLSSIKSGKVKIGLTKKTLYSIYSNSIDTKVKLEDIISGSNVEVICKIAEGSEDENEANVIALKVTKIVY